MTNNYIKTIILFIACVTNTYATSYNVYGKLIDNTNKKAVEFGSVVINSATNDSIVASAITNFDGEFVFNLPSGEYNITLRCMGYKEISKQIIVTSQNLYLKPYVMEIDSKILKEVDIVASSYQEQYDKSVQLITKQFKEGTSNVNDLLMKIRGVNIDPLSNSISIDNKNNILFLVDGIKKDQSYIKKISPDRIDRIELSRNPSGKYINEGYDGIVNIILKKNYVGYNITTEENALFSLNKANGDDFLFKNTASIDFTYNFKTLNIYTSYSNNKTNTNLPRESIKILNGDTLSQTPLSNDPNFIKDNLSHAFVLGTDIFITPKQTLSLELNVIKKPTNENHTNESYYNEIVNNESLEYFTSASYTETSEDKIYSQLSYRNNYWEKTKIEFDYCYYTINTNNFYNYSEDDESLSSVDYERYFKSSIVDLTFNHEFNEKLSLEAGYKNKYRNYNYLYFDQEEYSEEEKEIRNSFYTFLNISPQKKIKTKIGIALEQNTLKTDDQNNTNTAVLPYLSLYYKFPNTINTTLKLESTSTYPSLDQIDPSINTLGRLSKEQGNMNLDFATKYRLSWNLKLFENKLSIEPYYSFTNNYISTTGFISDSCFVYSYSNMDKYQSYGLDISTRIPLISKRCFINISAALYNDIIKYEQHSNEIRDISLNSSLIYLSAKHKTIYALMLKKMNTKQIQAYGYENVNNDYLGFFIKQAFFNRKMAVSLLYILPVDFNLDYYMNSYLNYNDLYKESTSTNVKMLKNLFMFNISYNLNKAHEIKLLKKKDYKEKLNSNGFFD